ncbi:hypothetical protein K440DRAFT_644388 [Wilcoxina mikolae CBS 423.85]|nr:hypothetical protein K440DRAFT_644388 [Wilcoxina mikolae CBS 423.85]
MKPDDVILEDITKDGSVDIDTWPDLLKRLLSRLDTVSPRPLPFFSPTPSNFQQIANDNFPKPTPSELRLDHDIVDTTSSQFDTQPDPQPSLSQASTQPCDAAPEPDAEPASSQATQPDNTMLSQDVPAAASPPKPMAPPPLHPSSSSLTEVATPPHSPRLHPTDITVLSQLKHTLTSTFSSAPPYTVQRLSELLLAPNTHYHSLPKFLRALQRVLSVSSPSTAFPLLQNMELPNGGLQNGGFGLGSDESLGGALLTPIPWLTSGGGGGGGEGHALSPDAAEPPALGPEDVGPQPEGTVFPDPPKSEGEITPTAVVEGERKDEEMVDAPAAAAGEEKEVEVEVEGKKDDVEVGE